MGISSAGRFGNGKKWRDLTASRALNTTYYNTSGKVRFINIRTVNTGGSNGARLTITGSGGSVLIFGDDPATGTSGFPMIIDAAIEPNAAYIASNTAQNLTNWSEWE